MRTSIMLILLILSNTSQAPGICHSTYEHVYLARVLKGRILMELRKSRRMGLGPSFPGPFLERSA